MAEQPLVIHEGPHAGLYVPLDGKFAYVKDETRPYAPLFNSIIYDSDKDVVFYTSSPHTFVVNPAYSVAPQSLQDKYANFYKGDMYYCNGVVHQVQNGLTTEYTIITPTELQKVTSWLSRRPMTPQTDQTVTPVTSGKAKITVYEENEADNAWLKEVDFDELLAMMGFISDYIL